MNSAADWYADQEQRERIMKTDTKAKLRLIDADALMKKVCGNCQRNDCTPDATDTVYGCMFAESINQMPTIEPEVRHGQWIPCSERLPEKHGEYLVCFGMFDCTLNGTDVIDKRYFGEKSDGTVGWHSLCSSDITHWMPLPDVPEEVEQNDKA